MKIKFLYIIIVIGYCLLNISNAQTIIEGKIINKSGNPIPDASVMLMIPADTTIIAFNFSNSNGEYTIATDSRSEELLLMVTGFNIKRVIKKVLNHSQKLDITVQEEAIELKEFTIKSEKIWGTRDTINYVVDAFRDSTDLVISDVLKKMPGIVVKESGQIEYRGKPISKFYIENMDMLQGRYRIATHNITASDIATVQVFENHQPIKAIADIAFTDDAAINLKLKPDAKGIYTSMADIGVGMNDQFLWKSTLTVMFFGKARQHLTALKSNNAGIDLDQEFQLFYDDNPIISNPVSSVVQPTPPRISKNKYLFNQAFGGSVNNLIKTKDDTELILNVNVFRDIDDRKSFDRTRYFLPGEDTITINEQMDSYGKQFNIDGGVGYKINTEKNYLNARFLFSGNTIDYTANIFSNKNIKQNGENNPIKTSAIIHWIKRGNNTHGFGTELNSKTHYHTQSYRLQVSPGMFDEVFNEGIPYRAIRQDVVFNSFETRNGMRFLSSAVWKSFIFSPAILFSFEHQTLNSDLSKSLMGDVFSEPVFDSMSNDLTWMRLKYGFSLYLSFKKRYFSFSLSTPVQHQYISLKDAVNLKEVSQNRIIFQPQTNIGYNINTHWDISASWGWYNYNPSLRNLYSGYILQNYRTLSHYDNRLSDTYGQHGSLKLHYKDIISFLFTSVEFMYNRNRSEIMYAQKFDGPLMKITAVSMENTGNHLSARVSFGKGFNWKNFSINTEASWGKGVTPQLRQDSLIEYNNQGLNANMTFSLSVTEQLQLANKISWSRISGNASKADKLETLNSFIEAANLSYIFSNSLILSLALEYYDTRLEKRTQDFFLLDAGITYTWKRVRLSLDYNNILNTTNYVYAYYGTLNSYYSEYRIRPASIMITARFKLF
ncbi:MAG: TonB-dependent receptor [Bacteroidales bacterium]|jgi:hypothetical protein|nr:TonB-dependent receptor [Bacteroidales bacterium]